MKKQETISDEKMKELLEKYPFLVYRNLWNGQKTYKTEKEDLEFNYYKYWDGYGWEKLWKKYLEKLFYLYDHKWSEETKKRFAFTEIKEKFGQLRIYTSFTDKDEDLELLAEMLSEWTCINCGKQPRDSRGRHIIWRSIGWIEPYCKECAKKNDKDEYKSWKETKRGLFGNCRYSMEKKQYSFYEDDGDGWLKLCKNETVWNDQGEK